MEAWVKEWRDLFPPYPGFLCKVFPQNRSSKSLTHVYTHTLCARVVIWGRNSTLSAFQIPGPILPSVIKTAHSLAVCVLLGITKVGGNFLFLFFQDAQTSPSSWSSHYLLTWYDTGLNFFPCVDGALEQATTTVGADIGVGTCRVLHLRCKNQKQWGCMLFLFSGRTNQVGCHARPTTCFYAHVIFIFFFPLSYTTVSSWKGNKCHRWMGAWREKGNKI